MAKYRGLSISELNGLEKEFIDFLIVNGISAEEWENILKNDSDLANQTLDLFSDVVFESILFNIKFLEERAPGFVHVYQCLQDKIVLVGLKSDGDDEVDFSNSEMLSSYMLTPPEGLKVFTSTKKYLKTRNEELFQMLENGCVITDNKLFKALCLSL
ncbi:MAG: hypothetical protein H7329_06710 [Opitutaceae bacterium]|nr:hypothetical protein [Cytophagales bacterium]